MTNTKKKSSLAVLALGLVLGFLTIAFFGKAPGAKVCHSPDCATFTQPVTES